jgi:hypothetical protein
MRRVLLLALLSLPVSAQAVDGVREINQACATTTGCFTGDTPGFPVTITQSGSYRLTSRLQRPNAATHGIQISTVDVTIDLNGFEVIGGTSCSGIPVSCSFTGAGRGITVDADFVTHVAVRNGFVRGSGATGIHLGQESLVENVRVAANGGDGIRVADLSHVLRCEASENGGRGIATLSRAILEGNVVRSTGAGMDGIHSNSGSTLRDNEVVSAGGDGIAVGEGAIVRGNIVGSSAGDGIEAIGSSRIDGNVISNNVGFGLRFTGSGAGYADNLFFLNGGNVTGPPGNTNLGQNLCDGLLCP